LFSDGYRPDRTLDNVRVRLQPPVLQEQRQARPTFERVVDRPDQSRLPRYAVFGGFEPRLQGLHQGLRLGLPDRAALVGVETADPLLNRVDGRDAFDDLFGEWRVRRLVDVDEVSSRVNETKRQADFPRGLLVARQRGIGGSRPTPRGPAGRDEAPDGGL